MPEMKFSERMVTLVNPCPSLTMADLCVMDDKYPKLAPNIHDDNRQVFSIEFPWSSGSESDILTMKPGEERSVPEALGRQIIRDVGERGLVMIVPPGSDKDPKTHRLTQMIQGLRPALNFYSSNGILRLQKLRRSHAWTEEEIVQLEHQHRAYYLNQRKHDLIEALVAKMTKDLASSQAKKSAA